MISAAKQAANFEAKLRDIAIAGNLSRQEETALGKTLRNAALTSNQSHDAILGGTKALVAEGIKPGEAGRYAAVIGKVATATQSEITDLTRMAYSFTETLGLKNDDQLKEAFSRVAYGSKIGRLDLKDLEQNLPELNTAFAAEGITGQDALTQIMASLAVGRESTGSGEEAMANMRSWVAHMNAPSTIKAYESAGIDYRQSMSSLVAEGNSSYEASLAIAMKLIESRGDAFVKQWKEAAARGDENTQRQLMESNGLGEIFQNTRSVNHVLAMQEGGDKYRQNKAAIASPQARGTIDGDFARRSEAAQMAWLRMKTQLADLGITVGNALLPPLVTLMNTLTPIIARINEWAQAHPGVVRAIAGLAIGIAGLRAIGLGARFGINLVLSAWNIFRTTIALFASKWTLLRSLWSGGQMAAGLGGFFRAALGLGRVLGGILLRSALMIGRILLWVGRLFLTSPIGLIVTGIATAGYLIYRNWDKIGPIFDKFVNAAKTKLLELWTSVKELPERFLTIGRDIVDGLINGIREKLVAAKDAVVQIGTSIKNWFADTLGIGSRSPVTDATRGNVVQENGAPGTVLKAQTTKPASGTQDSVSGTSPVTSRATARTAQAAAWAVHTKPLIARVGGGTGNSVATPLGLRPPSPVSTYPRGNIAQRAAIGIGDSSMIASRAAAGSALQAKAAASVSRIQTARAGGKASGTSAGGPAITVHFSPTITIQGGNGGAREQVMQGLKVSLGELEQMMARVTARQARRTYGG
ncbi:MAG: phage tail tape measure protein [Paraburkholderia sp.]|nr:MAG: phage tail tape measure protein [Paraburkholderia sp.]